MAYGKAIYPGVVLIPEGQFIMGSSLEEREAAYHLDEIAYDHTRTREWGWYDGEKHTKQFLPAYEITTTLITNAQYRQFIISTGHSSPDVSKKTWKEYGLIHPFNRTRRHAWKGVNFPAQRGNHPVVLVNNSDARAYAGWLSQKTGYQWRLPSEQEWEKAARGDHGRRFPWGETFDPSNLNSHDSGPFDTMPVGRFQIGKSPYGLLDAAGQVFEWTSTTIKDQRYIVKGGSWDDKGCGVCRPAARHTRPAYLKHILIGFRLVRVIPQ